MITKEAIKNLIRISQALDANNLYKESDVLTYVMQRISQIGGPHNYDQYPHTIPWKDIEQVFLEEDNSRMKSLRLQNVPKPGPLNYVPPQDADDTSELSISSMNSNPEENAQRPEMDLTDTGGAPRVQPYSEIHDTSDPGNYKGRIPHA